MHCLSSSIATHRAPRFTPAASQGGFSLIELMIVLTIINILASIAIPNYISARNRASFTGCRQSLIGLRLPMEMYLDDYGYYGTDRLAAYFFNDPSRTNEELEELVRRNCSDEWTVDDIEVGADTYRIHATPRFLEDCDLWVDPQTFWPPSPRDCIF
ncbi:MAG: prepilin-type N-terminal cleavage/methylation domain-containing protein [bacterium]